MKERSTKRAEKRKPAKRGPKMPRGHLVQELEEKAYELVEQEGAAALTARNLAEKVNVFHTLVTYYFGSMTGLLAAVAARGFEKLAQELVRAAGTRRSPVTDQNAISFASTSETPQWEEKGGWGGRVPGARHAWLFANERGTGGLSIGRVDATSQVCTRFGTLVQVALAHLRFGLKHPKLYLAMHEPRLWEQIGLYLERPARNDIHARTRPFLQRVFRAREEGFTQYLRAVELDLREVGAQSETENLDWWLGRLVAIIIDGYLFQVNCEKLHHRDSRRQHEERVVAFLEYPLRGALLGRGQTGD